MSEAMYVYSGKCRQGRVGQPTAFEDMYEHPLFVGDIVCIAHEDATPDHLTVVVSDEFTTYSDCEHRVKDGPVEHFVMGIKSVPLDEAGAWRVLRVKDHADVIDGEHWRKFGFRYAKESDE